MVKYVQKKGHNIGGNYQCFIVVFRLVSCGSRSLPKHYAVKDKPLSNQSMCPIQVEQKIADEKSSWWCLNVRGSRRMKTSWRFYSRNTLGLLYNAAIHYHTLGCKLHSKIIATIAMSYCMEKILEPYYVLFTKTLSMCKKTFMIKGDAKLLEENECFLLKRRLQDCHIFWRKHSLIF